MTYKRTNKYGNINQQLQDRKRFKNDLYASIVIVVFCVAAFVFASLLV